MKKWIAPLLSLLLIGVLLLISSPFNIFKSSIVKRRSEGELGILFAQDQGKEEQTDPHLILVLKRLREKLDEWIKSVNDRIESEDITRLEVRFLEILRSILGWMREKIDKKIESSEKEKHKETYEGVFPSFKVGWHNHGALFVKLDHANQRTRG